MKLTTARYERFEMQVRNKFHNRHGDSIIEVLLAVAIFSAIAVTSIAIMNKGLSSAQTALESTMVRTELDAQAEAIRFIEQAYETNAGGSIGRLWSTIVGKAISPDTSTADSDYNKLKAAIDGNNACLASTDLTGKYFLYKGSGLESDLNLSTSSIPSATNGGLWVVAVKNNNETEKEKIEYYDFYISACWDALNSPMPAKRTTIIRIHNPDYETAEPSMPEQTSQTEHLYVQFNLKKLDDSSFEANSIKWLRDGILDNMAPNDTESVYGVIESTSKPEFASRERSSIKIQYDYIFNTTSSEDEDTLNSSITIPEIGNYNVLDSVIDWNEISTEYELGQINSPEDLSFTCNYKSDPLDTSCAWQKNNDNTIEINIYLKQVALSQLEYNMNGQCAAMKPNSQEGRKRGGWTTSVSSTPAKGSVCTEGTNVYVFDRWRGSDGKDYNPGTNTGPIASGNTLTLTAQWQSIGTPMTDEPINTNEWNGKKLALVVKFACARSETFGCAKYTENQREYYPFISDESGKLNDNSTFSLDYSFGGKASLIVIAKEGFLGGGTQCEFYDNWFLFNKTDCSANNPHGYIKQIEEGDYNRESQVAINIDENDDKGKEYDLWIGGGKNKNNAKGDTLKIIEGTYYSLDAWNSDAGIHYFSGTVENESVEPIYLFTIKISDDGKTIVPYKKTSTPTL